MAERLRVFISHSALDSVEGNSVNARAHDVRVAIRDALSADRRFHVLISL